MNGMTDTYTRESSYLDRYVQLGIEGRRVVSVSFSNSIAEESNPNYELLDRIFEYLEGTKDDFEDVEITLTVPTDQRVVLEAVRGIPYGEQISVERLTRRMSNFDTDDDRRRVRIALAENPVPLVLPDHRVRDGPSAAPPKVEQKLRSLEGL
jgi:methylated-DNA-[protein]-cysteine S-methyltransferase